MTARKTVKNKTSAKQGGFNGKVIAGTAGAVVVIGAGGYALGVVTNQDIQDFEPVYSISAQELKSAKSTLSSLLVRSSLKNIPDYDSSKMPGWYDADNDGCPTNYDVLVRDLLNESSDDTNCKINSGTMFDYYTGTLLKYNRLVNGGGIDVDHVVAKGDAWLSGGSAWSNEQWKAYINDEDVLMATSAKANRSKRDKNASEWLPPNEKFWCKYVVKQVQIKSKYSLSVSASEKSTIEDVLDTSCNKD